MSLDPLSDGGHAALQLQERMKERVKELTCLGRIATLTAGDDTPERTLTTIAELLPQAMAFPDLCHAVVIWDGTIHTSGAQSVTAPPAAPVLTASLPDSTRPSTGAIRVWYDPPPPPLKPQRSDTESAFLPEEADLLNNVAVLVDQYLRRVHSEAALRRSEDLQRGILDSMASHVAVIDGTGIIQQTNETWRRFARDNAPPGYPVAASTGVGDNYFAACVGGGDGDAASHGIRAVLERRQDSFALEYPCHSPAAPRWFRMMVTPFGHNGAVIAHDNITERKLMEMHEAARARTLELLATGAPLAEVLSALALGVEATSPGALCSILLLDDSGAHLTLGAAPSLPDAYNAAIEGLAIGPGVGSCGTAAHCGEVVVVEDIATHPHWTDFRDLAAQHDLASCWSQPILDSDGAILGTFAIYHRTPMRPSDGNMRLITRTAHLAGVAIAHDRAARAVRASRDDLKRSNAELEQFAYAASHDLREPLRMVAGYIRLLERTLAAEGVSLSKDAADFMAFIRDGALRMDDLLVSLLEYSRVGRDGEPLEDLDSRALAEEALHFLTPAMAEATADIRLTGTWPTVRASRNEVVRLFQNLIGNAVKYRAADRAPHIEISATSTADGTAAFAVRDNGIGIPPDQAHRLFTVFQRLHSTGQYAGSGVGLAVCRKIVERHGGRITAASDGPGKGATFSFTLPLARGYPAGRA